MYKKNLLVLFFLFFGTFGQIFAQCPAPSTIGTPSIVHASCPGNGRIIAGPVSPAATAPNYYQYALYQSATEIKPWQSSDTFTSINAGTYEIRVRTVCSTGFSPIITRNVTVNNTEVPPSISAITINRAAKCNNGRFTVTATGSGPGRYSLVPSLTEPDPTMNYVRVPQTSPVFDSLPAGTYYVRVYNGCNNATTQAISVPAFTGAASLTFKYFEPYSCDSFLIGGTVANHLAVLNTNDTAISKWWISWPTGITDTFNVNPTNSTGNSSDYHYRFLPLSRIDAVLGTGSFPANLPNWPYTIRAGYLDICGNTYRDTIILKNPAAKSVYIIQSGAGSCDSALIQFRVGYTNMIQGQPLIYHEFHSGTNVRYSLDGGVSWKPAKATAFYSNSSDYITLPRGMNYTLKVAICGDTLTQNFTTQPLAALDIRIYEANRSSCPGKTGMSVGPFNPSGGPVGIRMNSAPAGQAVVPFFEIPGIANRIIPAQLSNLLPGTYSFTFYDTTGTPCPRQVNQTITLNTPFNPFLVTLEQQCNSDLWVETNNTYTNEIGVTNLPLSGAFNVAIYNTAGAKVLPLSANSYYFGATVGTTSLTRVTIPVSSLADGQYIIKARKHNAQTEASQDSCSLVEIPWTKGVNNGLNLNLSRFISGCPGGTSSIVAIAAQGKAPYNYTLRDAANAIVAPSSVSNIYNNLTNGATYTLQVIDACGSVVNRTMSVNGDLKPVVSANGPVVCAGDTASLVLQQMPGVTYEWQRNGLAIPGATSSSYTFNPVTFPQDSGVYRAKVLLGSCLIFTSQFSLTPGTCTALPIKLGNFDAQANNNLVLLKWTTLSESQNKGFYAQRSEDGVKWSNLHFIPSQAKEGKSSGPLAYTYTDKGLASGTYYYRLLQVSADGSSDYSEVRKVSVFNASDIRVIPNPAHLTAVILGLHQGDLIRIYTATGSQVYDNSIPDAQKELKLSIQHWAKGIYHITITHDNKQVSTHKLVVQ